MKTLIFKEAVETGQTSAAVKHHLVDLNVRIETKPNNGHIVEAPKPKKNPKRSDDTKPNYLLRLL